MISVKVNDFVSRIAGALLANANFEMRVVDKKTGHTLDIKDFTYIQEDGKYVGVALNVTNEPIRESIRAFRDGYAFLSNFFESPITYNGITYPSIENAYQAAKVDDPAEKCKVAMMGRSAAKSYGRHILLPVGWENKKYFIMRDLIALKFPDPIGGVVQELPQRLLDTGQAELIEGNTWHDCYWGECTCGNCVGREKQNWLGKLLMARRWELSELLKQ